MYNNKYETVKIPLLTQEELNELGAVMHRKDEFEELEFWEKIYARKELRYYLEDKLLNLFDSYVKEGNIHLNFVRGHNIDTMTDEDKINVMKVIYNIKKKKKNKK